jgi:hypothetical protein
MDKPELSWFQRWNLNRYPLGRKQWLWWLFLVVGNAVWAILTHALVFNWVPNGLPWGSEMTWAIVVAYFWTAILGGALGSNLVVEFTRTLFSGDKFRPFANDRGGQSQVPFELLKAPRIEPVVTGIIDRLLLTTIAIVLIRFKRFGALGGIAAAFVGLKSIKRMTAQLVNFNVSIRSLWGTGISVGYAVLGGWLFTCCQSAKVGRIGTRENYCYGEPALSFLTVRL